MAGEQPGKDFLLYVETSPGVFTMIGGQRGATLKRTNDTVDASHKTSGAWKIRLPGLKDWSISGDAVSILSYVGVAKLRSAYNASELVKVRFNEPDDSVIYSGDATIADLSIQTPHDGVATVSIELQAASPLEETAAT